MLGLVKNSTQPTRFRSIEVANALVLLAYGLTWAGARVFDGPAAGRCAGAATTAAAPVERCPRLKSGVYQAPLS
jgi:hypothetical protein